MQKKLMLASLLLPACSVYAQEGLPQAGSLPSVAPAEVPSAAPAEAGKIAPLQTGIPAETPTVQPAPAAQPEPAPAAPSEPVAAAQEQEAQPAAPAPEPVQAPQPEQPKEEPAQAQGEAAEEEMEIKGIDTVSIDEPKGNWLLKRIWWEKAERLYEKIKQLADSIIESRMVFFARRNELDRKVLDPFYFNLGFNQGELTEIIGSFNQQIEDKEGKLNENEQKLSKVIGQEKKTIEQLQTSAQSIDKLDQALDDALMKLVEQLNQVKVYEQQAWENFKAINRELSDKKARQLYFGMDTYWRNLNSINSYLSDAFSKYFDQISVKIKDEAEKVKTTIGGLKEKGIDLQLQAQKMRGTCKAPKKEEEQEVPQETEGGILRTIWNIVKTPFVLVKDVVSGVLDWIGSWFGGSSESNIENTIDVQGDIEEAQE